MGYVRLGGDDATASVDALKSLASSDTMKLATMFVGGTPGVLLLEVARHGGRIDDSTIRAAAGDFALLFAIATPLLPIAVIPPSPLAPFAPVILAMIPFAKALTKICEAVRDGRKIDQKVINDAVKISSSIDHGPDIDDALANAADIRGHLKNDVGTGPTIKSSSGKAVTVKPAVITKRQKMNPLLALGVGALAATAIYMWWKD